MKTIAVASGKGGVGKSSITTQLASILAHNGYKVGVIDADIYGPCQHGLLSSNDRSLDASSHVDSNNKLIPSYSNTHKIHYISVNNLIPNSEDSPMLWRAPIATKLIREFLQQVAWPELDYLFIDMPPGTGDIQITIAQLAKLDGAIIVTTPQKVAYDIAAKAIQMFNKVKVDILGIVENMSGYICTHCDKHNDIFNHNSNGGTVLAEKYHSNILGTIPLSHDIVAISDNGLSVMSLDDKSLVKTNYLKLAENFLNHAALKSNISDNNQAQKSKQDLYNLLDSSTLQINTDTTSVNLRAYDLRLGCQCALCKDEVTGDNLINKNIISKDITITNIHEVGNYGLRLTFSDGHGTGIYQIEKLEKLA